MISNHTKLQEVKLVKEKLENSLKFVNLLEPWFASLEFKSLGESYQGNLLKEIFESISSTNNLDC